MKSSSFMIRLTIFLPLTGEEIEDMIDCVVVQVTQFRSRDHFDDSYVGGSEEMRSISNSVEALCWVEDKLSGIGNEYRSRQQKLLHSAQVMKVCKPTTENLYTNSS